MIKLLFNTFATKALTAAITLGVVLLTSNVLGPEGRGEISLLNSNIGLILLFTQIVGGSSLVYLVPRFNPFQLLVCSVVWAIVLPITLIPLMHFAGIVDNYYYPLLIITVIYGISASCQTLLLGFEKINIYNILMLAQNAINILALSVLFFLINKKDIIAYLWSLGICYTGVMIAGLIICLITIHNYSLFRFWNTAREAIVKGITVQFSNLIQFLNYRLSLYFLSSMLSNLGYFSISLVLAEAIWLIGNSLSLVQYSKISNEKNQQNSIDISFKIAKISFWCTLTCVSVLIILPENFYSFFFGAQFFKAKYPTLILCPGIFAIGTAMAFSHYFAGMGRFKVNNIAALIGLAVKIPSCLLFVYQFKENGAALACTLSYVSTSIYLLIKFKKETGFQFSDFYLKMDDIKIIKALLK